MSRQSAALSSGTQHRIPPEFGKKWGTECRKILALCVNKCNAHINNIHFCIK